MFKKLAVWLLIHSRSTGRSTGFQNLLTVGRPRSTARSTVPNRELGAVSRSKFGRPTWGPVERPVDRITCTHARTQRSELRSTARSTVLTCNRAGRPSGEPQQVKTDFFWGNVFENKFIFKNDFCQDFIKYNKLSLQILEIGLLKYFTQEPKIIFWKHVQFCVCGEFELQHYILSFNKLTKTKTT